MFNKSNEKFILFIENNFEYSDKSIKDTESVNVLRSFMDSNKKKFIKRLYYDFEIFVFFLLSV